MIENFSDLILGRAASPRLPKTGVAAEPGSWRPVYLQAPFPWRGMTDSGFVHAALVGLLYAVSIWPPARAHLDLSHSYRRANAYELSPYLPELHGAPTTHKQGGKADPVAARQQIRSLPEAPDNLHQTIVTPYKLKLQNDVDVPNLIADELPPPAPPLDTGSSSALLQLPTTLPQLAEPPRVMLLKPQPALPRIDPRIAQPAPGSLKQKDSAHLAQLIPQRAHPTLPILQPVERPPVILKLKPQRALPRIPADVAQPAPGLLQQKRAANLALLAPPAAKPALPVLQPAQPPTAVVKLGPQRAMPGIRPSAAKPAPEPGSMRREGAPNLALLIPQRTDPALPALRAETHTPPPVVVLSVHPAEVPAPVAIPQGNRRGAFAASSSGHANSSGAPGEGDSSGLSAHEAAHRLSAPPGINVEAPPPPAEAVAAPNAPSAKPAASEPDLRTRLLAAMRPPVIASIPRRPPLAQETTPRPTELENHIFAGRRSYKLVVNMPNLNVPIGSWVIHYADRDQGLIPQPITAPEVIRKTDPAFPGDLIHDGIHGNVILTAIIRADGSVSDVAVAQGIYPELDRNAAEALSRWVFRPALKNGHPIDVVAVFTVPFRTK